MKSPVWNIEIDPRLAQLLSQIPEKDMQDFLQRCKENEHSKIDGALTYEDMLKVKYRAQFVDELKIFFKSLLTMPQK